MARLALRNDLEIMAAARLVRPRVEQLLEQLAERARRQAPDVKLWLTVEDDRVRPSHQRTHNQAVPANVPFKVPKIRYVRGMGTQTGQGHDLAMEPRDPNLPAAQRDLCRCISVPLPGVLARTIGPSPVTVTGPKVSGEVYTRFPRAAESEFAASGGGFMRAALASTAARVRH